MKNIFLELCPLPINNAKLLNDFYPKYLPNIKNMFVIMIL